MGPLKKITPTVWPNLSPWTKPHLILQKYLNVNTVQFFHWYHISFWSYSRLTGGLHANLTHYGSSIHIWFASRSDVNGSTVYFMLLLSSLASLQKLNVFLQLHQCLWAKREWHPYVWRLKPSQHFKWKNGCLVDLR